MTGRARRPASQSDGVMLNKYPLWKYLLILAVLILAFSASNLLKHRHNKT